MMQSIQRWTVLTATTVLWLAPHGGGLAAAQSGLRAPEGFEVTLYADDELAHDIFCMTVDRRGRLVVSGRGYVRILTDKDQDGRADEFKQLADGPQTGAQGMCFDGSDLICTGDAGLIRYRDRDGDDRVDGPPELLLKIKTGGEHHAHCVQKGPDGWWYVLAGNLAGVDEEYVTQTSSPVLQPQAGTLLRLSPDFSQCEVVAHGFRNAYDFAFSRQGEMFAYDSDGERDVTLPWYRPTRVFHVLPATHAGWVCRSWKRPAGVFPMPPVLAALGRGSPTGVICYRHHQFPPPYRGAIFVADWTYGRIVALPLEPAGATWRTRPILFLQAEGAFGFAPTDLAVGPDGSLYVSVGGRGTRGGVYRVRYVRKSDEAEPAAADASPLHQCLKAPQPLSSWSRARWQPLARQLGRRALVQAALDQRLAVPLRVRAIEILTELFGPLDEQTARRLTSDVEPQVRARAAWALGRAPAGEETNRWLVPLLDDPDPHVVRRALEALMPAAAEGVPQPALAALARQLASTDRTTRHTAARLAGRLSTRQAQQLLARARSLDRRALLGALLGRVGNDATLIAEALSVGLQVAAGNHPPEIRLDAVRLIQLALGDLGPLPLTAPVFAGYQSGDGAGAMDPTLLEPVARRLAAVYPTGHRQLDTELSRTLAMLQPDDAQLLDRLLAPITPASHPTDDLHQLLVAARVPAHRSAAERRRIARALLDLDSKVERRGLHRDTNWQPRLSELFEQLVRLDPGLPALLASQPDFGAPGHVIYLSAMHGEDRDRAVAAIAKNIRQWQQYPADGQVIFALAAAGRPEYFDLIRQLYEQYALRDAALVALARQADPADRHRFVDGLGSADLAVVSACLGALGRLPPSQEGDEQVALVRLLRSLSRDSKQYGLRERVVRLLRRNLQHEFGFQEGRSGYRPQLEVVGRWTQYVQERFPEAAARLLARAGEQLPRLHERLERIDWNQGDAARGEQLFRERSCHQCHGGRAALGPDLSGVARRFGRKDLFAAIALPSLDVPPRYQTTWIETADGHVYTGLVIYESIDGLLLRNSSNQTFRIESSQIEQRGKMATSLMPEGLLDELTDRDLADLYAYLRTL